MRMLKEKKERDTEINIQRFKFQLLLRQQTLLLTNHQIMYYNGPEDSLIIMGQRVCMYVTYVKE